MAMFLKKANRVRGWSDILTGGKIQAEHPTSDVRMGARNMSGCFEPKFVIKVDEFAQRADEIVDVQRFVGVNPYIDFEVFNTFIRSPKIQLSTSKSIVCLSGKKV